MKRNQRLLIVIICKGWRKKVHLEVRWKTTKRIVPPCIGSFFKVSFRAGFPRLRSSSSSSSCPRLRPVDSSSVGAPPQHLYLRSLAGTAPLLRAAPPHTKRTKWSTKTTWNIYINFYQILAKKLAWCKQVSVEVQATKTKKKKQRALILSVLFRNYMHNYQRIFLSLLKLNILAVIFYYIFARISAKYCSFGSNDQANSFIIFLFLTRRMFFQHEMSSLQRIWSAVLTRTWIISFIVKWKVQEKVSNSFRCLFWPGFWYLVSVKPGLRNQIQSIHYVPAYTSFQGAMTNSDWLCH